MVSIAVEHDLKKARAWYQHSVFGLEMDFIHSVEDVLTRILNNPTLYLIVYLQYQRALVRRFSYSAIYRTEQEKSIVSAVMHTSRAPSLWQSRISTH